MKAVRVHKFGGPEVLVCEEVNVPPKLESNEVLVEVKSAGINPVDTYIRAGTYSISPQLPYIPGFDAAGIIKNVHPDISDLKIGQRVFVCAMKKPWVIACRGTYAQYITVNREEVYPLADRLTFSEGASLGIPYFTAYRAIIISAKAKAGDTVLIHGASGGVGLACVQIGKAYGMTIFATAGTPEGIAEVKKCGADRVFCHREKKYMEDIMDATRNKGCDVIIDMLSNINLGKDIPILTHSGCVIVVGSRGQVTIDPGLLMLPEKRILGSALPSSKKEEMEETSRAILKGIDEGWVNPVIDKEYALEDAPQAHQDIIHSKGAKGNLTLRI